VEALPASDDPAREKLIADSIGVAMLVVLETLTPAERVAFVLHDLFDFSFDDIAPIVGRSSAAARQLASRARRRVHGSPSRPAAADTRQREVVADRSRQLAIVSAFLAASRGGDFTALLAVLDPDVVLRADAAAIQAAAAAASKGAPQFAKEVHGAVAVAELFKGRAQAARLATLDGAVGAVYAPGGTPRVAFEFTIEGGSIVGISVIADPQSVRGLQIAIVDD
jgi:RNA polymerase sigma-70 factor (ECF subfamily)